jgi:hypothetical protein
VELGVRVEFLVMKCQCCFYDYCVSVIEEGETAVSSHAVVRVRGLIAMIEDAGNLKLLESRV